MFHRRRWPDSNARCFAIHEAAVDPARLSGESGETSTRSYWSLRPWRSVSTSTLTPPRNASGYSRQRAIFFLVGRAFNSAKISGRTARFPRQRCRADMGSVPREASEIYKVPGMKDLVRNATPRIARLQCGGWHFKNSAKYVELNLVMGPQGFALSCFSRGAPYKTSCASCFQGAASGCSLSHSS